MMRCSARIAKHPSEHLYITLNHPPACVGSIVKSPNWIWDPNKAILNERKHSVSFELAQLVFRDPFHLSQPDPHDFQERWRTLGLVGHVVLFVVHTLPDENPDVLVGRIISARKATARERRVYEYGE
jgi:uncharacterized DUF497 family protein